MESNPLIFLDLNCLIDSNRRFLHRCARWSVLRRYDGFGQDVLQHAPSLMRSLAETRLCELCQHSFDLQGHTFTYASSGSKFVDLLYPNLFARVCPRCFEGPFRDYRRGGRQTHLARLYELFLLTGRVPTQDFDSLFYSCRDHDSILRLIELLKRTRTPCKPRHDFLYIGAAFS